MAKDTPQPGGIPNRPYQAPQEDPNNPYVPAPRRRDMTIANLADGEPDASIMNYVTEKGYFLDGQGNSYLQIGGKFTDKMEYNPDLHGLPVPLVKNKKRSKLQIANITPKDFTPLPVRYIDHIKTKGIKDAEMKHFKDFLNSTGMKWDLSKKKSKLMIG